DMRGCGQLFRGFAIKRHCDHSSVMHYCGVVLAAYRLGRLHMGSFLENSHKIHVVGIKELRLLEGCIHHRK
ncbi:5524_t:CDS:2, partial [Acaulospora morrowiae]